MTIGSEKRPDSYGDPAAVEAAINRLPPYFRRWIHQAIAEEALRPGSEGDRYDVLRDVEYMQDAVDFAAAMDNNPHLIALAGRLDFENLAKLSPDQFGHRIALWQFTLQTDHPDLRDAIQNAGITQELLRSKTPAQSRLREKYSSGPSAGQICRLAAQYIRERKGDDD